VGFKRLIIGDVTAYYSLVTLQRITQSRTVITVIFSPSKQSGFTLQYKQRVSTTSTSKVLPIYATGGVPTIHDGNRVLCLALEMET
jgi:hypothetical protein